MQSHFGVEDSKAEEVKRLVRSYPSMRFESNPWSIGGRTYFRISGDVNEFNDFQMKLYESERTFQQSVQPTCSTCGAKLRSGDIWWNECENCHSKIASG